MTPSGLKYLIEQSGNERYFFTRNTMRFFGDTMRNYGVRSAVVETLDSKSVDVWELYRRRPVKHGLQSSAYFDKVTLNQVFTKVD